MDTSTRDGRAQRITETRAPDDGPTGARDSEALPRALPNEAMSSVAADAQQFGRDPERCASFGAHSFALIQELIFEARGCTAVACHGEMRAGALDLRSDAAWTSLYEVPSSNADLLRVKPQAATESALYRKLVAAARPGSVPIVGEPMPRGLPPLSDRELAAIALWIDSGAPKWGAVSDPVAAEDVRSLLDPACAK